MTLGKTEDQFDSLVFETTGSRNRLWIWIGGMMLVAGSMALVSLVHRLTYEESLQCERSGSGGRCTLQETSLLRERRSTAALDDVVAVRVKSEQDPAQLIVLASTENLRVDIEREGRATRAADEFRALLGGKTGTTEVRRGYKPRWAGPLFSMLLFFGVAGVLFSRMTWTTVRFNPERLVLDRQYLWRSRHVEEPLRALERADVETVRRTAFGSSGSVLRYRVVLERADADALPLTIYFHGSQEHAEEVRDRIDEFLSSNSTTSATTPS